MTKTFYLNGSSIRSPAESKLNVDLVSFHVYNIHPSQRESQEGKKNVEYSFLLLSFLSFLYTHFFPHFSKLPIPLCVHDALGPPVHSGDVHIMALVGKRGRWRTACTVPSYPDFGQLQEGEASET